MFLYVSNLSRIIIKFARKFLSSFNFQIVFFLIPTTIFMAMMKLRRFLFTKIWLAIPFSSSVNEFVSEASGSSHELSIKLVAAFVRESCPTLVKAINHLEYSSYLANGFISKLVPGTVINPHRGRSNDFMRIHLGIDCDPNCRITVGTESQSWKDGSLLAFKDGGPYLHSVRHSGIKDRVIISCDVSLHYLSNFSIDLKLSQH